MSSPTPPTSPAPGLLLAGANLPRRVHEALELALDLTIERITQPFARALPLLADQVTALDDFGARHRVTFDTVDASERLLRDGAAMTRLFVGCIERDFATLRDRAVEGAEATGGPAVTIPSLDQLSLVDEDEDNAQTIIGALALRNESRSALPVQLLCQRFAVLAASPAFDPGTLPVGPRRLAENLAEAATAAGYGVQLTAALLREFDRHLVGTYTDFAETLNGLLSRLGVMPGLNYVPLRPRPRSQAEEATPPSGSTASFVPVSTQGAPASRGAGGAPGQPLAGHGTYGAAADDMPRFDTLRELLAARRGAADRFRQANAAGVVRAQLDTASAVRMLAAADNIPLEGDFEALRQWLLLRARHVRGEAVSLAPADADTFELLGLLYEHIASEIRPDGPASRMLTALRLPLVVLALQERTFFEQSSSPARRVLNAVAEIGSAERPADDIDPQLLQHVQAVVDQVARAPADNPAATFTLAAEMLDTQQQASARRAEMAERRSVEAARGKDRLAVARRRAAAVIDTAIGDLRLPVFHRSMLRQAWADVLTLAHLRHGEDAEEWISLVGDTRDLALAGASGTPAPEGIAAQVEQWLMTVGHHEADAARIARILTASVEEEIDSAATRTELAMRLKGRVRLGEDAPGEAPKTAPRTPAEEAAYARLRTLPFGSTLTFIAEDGTRSRRRLAWWSPMTDAVLFVNQRGQRVAESTLDLVARDIAAGRAVIRQPDEPGLVDRAWSAVVRSLRALNPGVHNARALR